MSDLEGKIAHWRRQMAAGGIGAADVLDELEGHLREEVERQMRSGLDAPPAFNAAVQRMGKAATLRREFDKIGETSMKHILTILAALFGMILGLSMVLPQLGQWSRAGIMPSPPFLFVGTGLVIAGGVVTFCGLRRRRAARGRKWIDVCIVAAGIFYAMPFIFAFFQTRATNLAGWIFCAALSMASVVFFGACLYFNRRLSVPSIDEGRCRN